MTNDMAKRLAIQIACQLPDQPADQRLVLEFLCKLMDWLNDAPQPDPAANGDGNVVPLRRPIA
jgi:hypothetical protein